jgi:hypothetical protein
MLRHNLLGDRVHILHRHVTHCAERHEWGGVDENNLRPERREPFRDVGELLSIHPLASRAVVHVVHAPGRLPRATIKAAAGRHVSITVLDLLL